MIHRFVDEVSSGIVAYHWIPSSFAYQQIWKVPATGGTPTAVTTQTTTTDSDPQVSPDDTKIAFLRVVSGFERLHICNADGSGVTQLDATNGARAPCWHPDGSVILYRIGSQFFTIEPDGSNKTDITPVDAGLIENLRAPVFNRDGTKIAFVHDRLSSLNIDELWVCNADGSSPAKVANMGTAVFGASRHPSWAHASDVIAFVERVAGTLHVSKVNADGTGQTQLTNTSLAPAMFKYAWSDDDSVIVLAEALSAPWTLYAVSASGGQAALSPTLDGNNNVGQGIPINYHGRHYVVRETTFDLVSVQPDGSGLRVEHNPGTNFVTLTGNGTEL